ncbi:MAG: V-type ATP synthase subunit A [Clostridiales bacterium]|jgi:V/A-type H+-transporting ATPase subunit A|nr:V-type ATP synthase subunit A [Clostridiales bacterium]
MENMKYISRINGPVVKARGDADVGMLDVVLVGNERLIGEVIGINGDEATIQVYESTSGLKPSEPVSSTGSPLSVKLGPGLIGNIFDGIERPLQELRNRTGNFISRGLTCDSIDTVKKWHFVPCGAIGDEADSLKIVGTVQETTTIEHRVMIPYGITGELQYLAPEGDYTVTDVIAQVKTRSGVKDITMLQEWPVRTPRPIFERMTTNLPLITGQRIIDTLFPLARGGTAAIPGSFGTGKTMTQHQLACWSDADIIVYIGCGERGNEMTEVLEDFPKLSDPRTGRTLMERTILIANTSNMPVAAREASIYTGVTLAEYYRDMGYDVAIMADSTSRWAEALREISGRLEEMPAEEGFPAYLPSRLSEFYGRAGRVQSLNGKFGSVSIIGAVSPASGDFSEPVTQNTKRFVRCFWGLDRQLAYSRHYPAINWLTSYSEYSQDLDSWFNENVDPEFVDCRLKMAKLLGEESNLMEIVKLVGGDVLPEEQKLVLEIGRVIRLGFLQQSAFHKIDTYVPLIKQFKMMWLILSLYDMSYDLVKTGIPVSVIKDLGYFDECTKMKYSTDNENMEVFNEMNKKFDKGLKALKKEYADHERRNRA